MAHTQQKWIPHSSRGKTLRSGCQRGRVRAPSRLQMAGSSLCPHVAEGARELTEVSSFTQALIAFIEVSPSRPNLLPKVPPPRTVTLGEKDFDIWILETRRCSVHDRTKARGEATVGRNRWWRHVWWVSGYQVRERATLRGEQGAQSPQAFVSSYRKERRNGTTRHHYCGRSASTGTERLTNGPIGLSTCR